MSRLRFILAAALLAACEGGSAEGDPTVLPGVNGGGGSAEADASAAEGGAQAAAGAAGEHTANTPDAAVATQDAVPESPPDLGPDLAPDLAPLPVCEGEPYVPLNERVTIEANGLHYQGLEGDAAPLRGILIDIRDTEGRLAPGRYDLAGTNLADCEVCVAGVTGCDPATGRCQKVFYPRAGVIDITSLGTTVGERFTATIHGLDMEQVRVEPDTNRSTPVPNGDTWCNAEQTIDQEIQPRPVMLGETVGDFSLQNCETGDMVSLYELAAEAKAVWIVATAGWCTACEEFDPQALAAMDQIEDALGPDALKPMMVVGEDANYARPTLDYCARYARHYGADPARFYIDHDGTSGFATLFRYIWPYIGPGGEFGLPWNAIIRGRTFEYFYADRSGQSDLNTALNEVLR